jgi:hypothetical protein
LDLPYTNLMTLDFPIWMQHFALLRNNVKAN